MKCGLSGVSGLSGIVEGYSGKVISYSPIAYWPLWEESGTTARCLVNPAQNGTYIGVTLGQTVTDAAGRTFICPVFDGANDYVNVQSAALAAAFNGSAGSIALWMRVFNVGVWSDATNRYMYRMAADGNNLIYMYRVAVANNVSQFGYGAGGTFEASNHNASASINWLHYVMTWNKAADQVIYYYNGAAYETDTALGVWAGALTSALLGANSTTPTGVWYGWLSHCALWNRVLTAPQIADLAVA